MRKTVLRLIVLACITFSSGLIHGQGYTTPADADGNGIYDYLESGTAPTITTQPTNESVCIDDGVTFSVSATVSDPAYQWQVSTNGGSTFTDVYSNSAYDFSGDQSSSLVTSSVTSAANGYQFRVIIFEAAYTCDSTISNPAILTVLSVSPPTGSANQTFCSIDNPTLSDLVVSGPTIQWYSSATGGSALSNSTSLNNGTTYYASATAANGCESTSRLAVTVTVNDPAAPTGSASQTFCSIDLPTVSDLSATGSSVSWYASASSGTALASTTSLLDGTTYYATQTASGCESDTRLAVTVTVNDPSAPAGSASQTFCSIDLPTVSDLSATGSSVAWYASASGGSAMAITAALVDGTTYYATQTSSGCESDTRLAVTVTVNDPSAPTGSSTQSFCALDTPTISDLTATGTAVQWYANATGGSPLAGSASVSNGSTYYATQTASSCESDTRFAVTVSIGDPAAPTGSASQTFCSIDTPTLDDITVTGSGILWYANATGGTALTGSTALVTGTTYHAAQNPGTCESTSRLAVTVTVNDPAAPTGSASQTFCSIDLPTVSDLSATGSSVSWYASASSGTALASTTSLLDGTTYYATQTASGCESDTRLAVTVTVNDPSAPTGSASQTFCSIDLPTVSDLSATGSSVSWYASASGGSAMATTAALVDGTTYYATQTSSGCESDTRLAVTVTVNDPSAPTGSSTQSFCALDTPTISDLTATGTAVQWYANATGGSPLAGSASVSNGSTYYATQTASSCESDTRFAVTVSIGDPAAPTGSASQTFCSIDTPTLDDITVTGSGILWYANATGGAALTGSTALVTGTTYHAAQNPGTCESTSRLAVTVTVNDPAAPTGSASQTFCSIDLPTVSDLSATGSSVSWYASASGGTALSTTTALVNGTTYYATQTASSCESDTRFAVTVTVNDPSAPTGSATQDFCSLANPTVGDLTATGTSIQWYTNASGGTALTSTTNLLDGNTYYATQTVSGCESDTRFSVTVSWTSVPAPSAFDQGFCAATSPTIADLVATGTAIQWYAASTGGAALASTTVLVDGVSYFATQTVGGCESSRAEVVVTVSSGFTVSCSSPGTVPVDASCVYSVPDLTSSVSVTTCATYTVTQTPSVGATLAPGTHLISFEISSGLGTQTCDYSVVVEDQMNPVAVCQNISVQLDVNGNVSITANDIDNGSSDNCTIDNMSIDISSFTCSNLGTNNVTLTVEDIYGNIDQCVSVVTVIDDLGPTITTCPSIATAPLNANCEYVVPNLTAIVTATDNCSSAASLTVTQSPAGGTILSGEGSHTLTFTVEDENGNITTCSNGFTVFDGLTPDYACPYPGLGLFDTVYVSVDANCEFIIPDFWATETATDNCTASSDIIYTQTIAPGTALTGADTYYMIQVRAEDESGNIQACAWYFGLVDDIAPQITTCPSDDTVSADASCEFTLDDYTLSVVAIDNCSPSASLIITQSPTAGSTISGSQVVTLTAEDESGNTTTCQLTVTVDDDSAPVPDVATLALINEECSATLLAPTATDNCQGSITATTTDPTTYSAQGTYTVTWTYDDGNGNVSQQDQTVVIDDVTDPNAVCQSTTLNLGGGTVTLSPSDVDGGSTDNCGIQSMSVTPNSFTAVGTYTVTLTVVDIAGNTDDCTIDISVEDTSAPVAVCQDITIYLDENGEISIIGEDIDGGSTDNGTIVDYAASQTDFDCSNIGPNNVQLVVTDDASPVQLTDNCLAIVTVLDTISPQVICQDITVFLDSLGNATIDTSDIDNGSADNCDIASMSLDVTSFDCSNYGANTVVLTVTDDSGNFSTCSATVTIEDMILPVLTCPAQITVSNDPGLCGAVVNYSPPAVWDNCSSTLTATIMDTDQESGEFFPVGITWVGYYANNPNNGLLSTCTFAIIVEDTEGPSLTCPGDDTVAADANCQFTLGDYTSTVTVTDNCDAPADISITQFPAPGTVVSGTQEVVLTMTDMESNVTTCSFDVVVDDTTNPSIDITSCPGDQSVSLNDDCEYIMPDFSVGVTATDNCNAPADLNVVQVPAPGTIITGHGTVTAVSISVSDGNANFSVCDFLLTTLDTTPAEIDPTSCPSDQNVSLDTNCEYTLGDFTSSLVITDNCALTGAVSITQSPAPATLYNTHGEVIPVTLTVEDGNGNSTICSFNVTVEDTTAPTIVTCPGDDNVSANSDCDYVVGDYTGLVVVTDNCGASSSVTITQSPVSGTIISGTTTLIITATDVNGVSETCSLDIIIDDTTDPTIDNSSCPNDTTVYLDSNCEYAIADFTGFLTVSDNCTADALINITQTPAPGTTFSGDGTLIPVVLTVEDANGNSEVCTFDITLEDNTAPAIDLLSCPNDTTVSMSVDCDYQLADFTGFITVSDNCTDLSSLVVTQSPLANTILTGHGSVHTITLSVDDGNGNVTTCIFDLTLIDSTAPTFVSCAPNETVSANDDCEYLLGDYTGLVTVTDNCGDASTITLSQNPPVGDIISGSTTVVITATDQNGVSETCSFDIIIDDTTDPVIDNTSCPNDTTVHLNASCEYAILDYTSVLSVTDNCSSSATINVTQSPLPGTLLTHHNDSEFITLTATDANGNSTICTFTVSAIDVTDPVIICPADISVGTDPGLSTALVNYAEPIGTDNCSGQITAQTDITALTSGSLFPVGITTLEYTVTDLAGNSTSCSFEIAVIDSSGPEFQDCPVTPFNFDAPSDACDTGVPVTLPIPVVTDNDGVASLVNDYNGTGDASDIYPLDTTIVTWTAIDLSGNIETCEYIIVVHDVTPPVNLVCPNDTIIESTFGECGIDSSLVTLTLPTAFDQCSPLVITNDAPGYYDVGQTTVNWTIADTSGNEVYCTQLVTITDTQNPVLVSCQGDITVNADNGLCGAVVTYNMPVMTDNCVDVTCAMQTGLASGSIFSIGVTSVVIECTDSHGNSTLCSFEVTVIDNQDPVITWADDVVFTQVAGTCDASVTFTVPTVSDNCAGATITQISGVLTSGDVFGPGTTTLCYEAIDVNGNSSELCIDIVIVDIEDPVLVSCPDSITQIADSGVCGALVNMIQPVATDNCGNVNYSNDYNGTSDATDFYPVGETTVVWTMSDDNGNSINSCAVVVTIFETEVPVIACPADVLVTAVGESCDAMVSLPGATAVDNCQVDSVWNSINSTADASGVYPLGETSVTWYAVDIYGNLDSCTMMIEVQTPYAPVISCIVDTTVTSDAGVCGANVILAPVTATLPCSIIDMVNDYNSTDDASGFYPVGTTTVFWTVTDISGNVSECSHIVIVTDNEAPSITCPDDISVANDPGFCGAVLEYELPLVDDNCEVSSLVLTDGLASGSEFPVGDTDVEWTVTDASGNSTSCVFTVTVMDIEAPSIVCPEDIVTTDSLVNFDYPDLYDNCYAELILITDLDSGDIFPHGYNEVCFAASDAFGNVDSCCFQILVNRPPVAINDTLTLFESNDVHTLDLFENDYDLDGDSIFVVSYDPGIGVVYIDDNGMMVYDIPDDFCGVDSVMYIISDIYGATDTAWAFIEVECHPDVFVPDAFSPNGDGVNDILVILGLRNYPENELLIFNRWGHKVYEAIHYENDWDGRSEASMTLGQSTLPRGTYFYILDLHDGSSVIKGFIYINDR